MGMYEALSCLLLLVAICATSIEAKCGDYSDCASCATHKDGLFDCRWCVSTTSCHDYSIDLDCPSNMVIHGDSYDCPRPPANGFGYDENFAKNKALPLMAASYSNSPQTCLTNALPGATVKRQLTVHCDESQSDTCSAFTGSSSTDNVIFASFRGSSGTWQLVMEGIDSIFKAKKPFVGGGNVDEYFFNAFYSIWNSGMRDDLLTLKAAHPDWPLWVVGHSLGGSMASLCAALAIRTNMWPANKVKLLTFGQPRTGDIDYAKAHDNLVIDGYRVVHAHDLVPHIPPKTFDNWFDGPFHHRYEVWYNNGMTQANQYQLCTRSDDQTCSNTQTDLSINDHLHYFNIDISAYGNAGCPRSLRNPGQAFDDIIMRKHPQQPFKTDPSNAGDIVEEMIKTTL